ncbi:hypothetical protein [Corynebacterium sp. HMSC29G08]|uniref:hypothetical protein n=1 Tax=Corynebacterium sp. HMSC29G08 TaxID=1581069 RepID=UPI0008A20529|nr:hypothetical protein [Corynebacterium sp. HMSC29G08]OFT82698.1 hypothetical protein HMPREF3101_07225 [Corynebacterium sp. HMSC29G08]
MRITKLSFVTVLSAALAAGCSDIGDDSAAPSEQTMPETTAATAPDASTANTTSQADENDLPTETPFAHLIDPDDPSTVYEGVTIGDLFTALNRIDGYQTEEITIDTPSNEISGKYPHLELPTQALVKAFMLRDGGEPLPLKDINDSHLQFLTDQIHELLESEGYRPVDKTIKTPNYEWKCVLPEDVDQGELNHSACFTVVAGRVIEVQRIFYEEDAETVGPVDNLLKQLDVNLAPLKQASGQ